MIKTKTVHTIDVHDWDNLVKETYSRPYCFQQQDGCKDRQRVSITVPVENPEDYRNESVPEVVNGWDMGVSFKAWLKGDSKQLLPAPDNSNLDLKLFWGRKFYPHVDMIINDLHAKGLLPAGEYEIDIDW